ncbi:hypothetical protein METEAL_15230 [Mesoterricola silvestris]|uniref:Uncharacterized protein n=1 Tax=Mesoterricola silvestris TaxID=2927979 RepID=A0AA48K7X0_9BACT|nr:hypothetical protein METEAL_15230 [Mesoterricola silvestris]
MTPFLNIAKLIVVGACALMILMFAPEFLVPNDPQS